MHPYPTAKSRRSTRGGVGGASALDLRGVGTAAVRLALLAGDLRQLPLSEPMVALLLGVAFGKELPGLLDIEEQVRDVVLLEGARLLLAWSVMATALGSPRLPSPSPARPANPPATAAEHGEWRQRWARVTSGRPRPRCSAARERLRRRLIGSCCGKRSDAPSSAYLSRARWANRVRAARPHTLGTAPARVHVPARRLRPPHRSASNDFARVSRATCRRPRVWPNPARARGSGPREHGCSLQPPVPLLSTLSPEAPLRGGPTSATCWQSAARTHIRHVIRIKILLRFR